LTEQKTLSIFVKQMRERLTICYKTLSFLNLKKKSSQGTWQTKSKVVTL